MIRICKMSRADDFSAFVERSKVRGHSHPPNSSMDLFIDGFSSNIRQKPEKKNTNLSLSVTFATSDEKNSTKQTCYLNKGRVLSTKQIERL